MEIKILRLKTIQLVVGILLLNYSLYAQTIALPNVRPVSPTAAAMFKVLEKPLGASTGTVPVTFDLFSISDGKIAIPIKLDYNSTGGIKVEEIAGSVGLGFSLSVGGRITRIPNGLPDDYSNGGSLFNRLKPSMFNPTNPSHLELLHLNQFDKAPDVFMFNVNGHSGKFMFDEDRNIVMMEKSDVTIRCRYNTVYTGIEGFDVYDSDGTVYIFNMAETTQQSYNSISGLGGSEEEPYKSTWVLTSIRDHNGQNVINLEYEFGESHFSTLSGGFMKVLNWNVGDCNNSSNNPDQVIVGTSVSELWVKRISGGFGYIDFRYTRDRLENSGGGKLRDIVLYNNNNDRIKKVKFNYGYIGNGASARLKLINFSEFSSNDLDSLSHRFEYEDSTPLPPRGSNSVDLWGYYNGRLNSTTFPNISTKFYNTSIVLDNLANREADGFYGQSNILKKITFPTGATRHFFYEGNTVLPVENDHFLNSSVSIPRSIYVDDWIPASFPAPNFRKTFDVNTSESYTTVTFELTSALNNAFRIEVYGGNYTGNYGEGSFIMEEYVQRNFNLQLPSGTYTILIYTFDAIVPIGPILSASWTDRQQLPQDKISTPYGRFIARNQEVGGVRVKKISDYDPATGQTLSTDYQYNMFSTNSNLTSGLLSTPIRLLNEYSALGCLTCQYVMLFANPTYPLAMNGNSYVVYPEVRTSQSGNGYTDQNFAYWQENIPDETQYPIVPIVSKYDSYRGKLLNEKIFNDAGTIVSEKTYTYSQLNTVPKIIKAKVIRLKYYAGGSCMEYSIGQLPNMPAEEITYEYSNMVFDITNYEEKVYTSQGTVSTNVDYTYSIIDGTVIKKKMTSNSSDSAISEIYYRYPDDPTVDFYYTLSSNEVAIKDVLKSRFYKQPIEVVRKVVKGATTTIKGGEKYNFSSFGNNIYHLGNYRSYTPSNDFEDIIFLSYNSKGNLQEFRKSNNSNSIYIWGYNNQYPIIEIKNATYAEVITALTQASIDNLNSSSQTEATMETLIKGAAEKLRTNLSQSMVTSYTYKPLVGMTSKTDARGITEYYKYDGMQRLQTILDHLNNVNRSFDYHYRSN